MIWKRVFFAFLTLYVALVTDIFRVLQKTKLICRRDIVEMICRNDFGAKNRVRKWVRLITAVIMINGD